MLNDIYNDANYKIECEKRSKEQISDTIVKIYETKKN